MSIFHLSESETSLFICRHMVYWMVSTFIQHYNTNTVHLLSIFEKKKYSKVKNYRHTQTVNIVEYKDMLVKYSLSFDLKDL